MGNPKIVAVISGIAALFLAYSIFGPSDEAPSAMVNLMNWVFFLLAVVAFIGSVIKMSNGKTM